MGKINYSTYSGVKKKLLEIFRKENFPNNKLPSESGLSLRLGVSLVTLRESLLMLAMEGFITKKHGSGNYVHPSALDPNMRIDLVNSFTEMLEQSGYHAKYIPMGHFIEEVDELVANKLGIPVGEKVFTAIWHYMADDKLAIVAYNRIPLNLFQKDIPVEMPLLNLDDFLWEYCHQETSHSLSNYAPYLCDNNLAELFNLKSPSAILVWKQIFYSVADEKLSYNEVFFNPEIGELITLRNRYFRE
ncbi:MAG: GntR family transcriptional regulator [Firmicutes bacterium]|nr:GntR family transcriptional regulator [Bacillota bacterium]